MTHWPTVAEVYDQWMCRRFGLRPSKARICPRVVAGKRCCAWRHDDPAACLCQRFAYLLDHQRIWRDSEGHYVLTSEPYYVDERMLHRLRRAVPHLHLVVDVTPFSMWSSGSTRLIVIRPEAALPLNDREEAAPMKGTR